VLALALLVSTLAPFVALRPNRAEAVRAGAGLVTFVPGVLTVNSVTQYTVNFTTGNAAADGIGALAPGAGTITITFPSGVVLPATIDKSRVAVNGMPLNVDPSVTPSTRQVILVVPGTTPGGATITAASAASVDANEAVVVFFSQLAGIANPAVGGLAGTGGASTAGQVLTSAAADVAASVVAADRVNYTRTLVHSPSSGARATAVTSTASGFVSGTTATLTTPGGAVLGSGSVGTDGKATITWTATVPPLTAAAATALTVTDGSGNALAANFTVTRGITLSPTSGPPGTVITVTGADFPATDQIDGPDADALINDAVTLGGVVCSAGTTAITGSAAGTFSAAVTCTAPAGAAGVRTLAVTTTVVADSAAVTNTVSKTFEVTGGTIALSPSSGVRGSNTTLTGSGFAANSTIAANALTVNGVAWNDGAAGRPGAITIDANGNLTPTVLPIGAGAAGMPTAAGAYAVAATDGAGRVGSASLTISAAPLALSPSSGPRGTTVTVSATGLGVSAAVALNSITFGTGNAATHAAITTDSAGNLPATTMAVPAATATGAVTVSATDATPLTARGTFTVTVPTIALGATSGVMGDNVAVTGSGWVPNTSVTLTFAGQTSSAVTNSLGGFTVSVAVPTTVGIGPATVTFNANDGVTRGNVAAPVNFAVGGATISASPTSVTAGSNLTVTGGGFVPGVGVTAITIGGAVVTPATPIITTSNGSFTAAVLVPGLSGVQLVAATVGGTVRTTSVTVTAAVANVATQLQSISAQLQTAWAFDQVTGKWKLYQPGAPAAVSDLTALRDQDAVVIVVSAATTLTTANFTRNLVAGTNIFGWR
jgi:hypothetical protein